MLPAVSPGLRVLHAVHIHINLYNCSWFFLSQYNITTSNVHKRMGIEHFQYLCK